MFIYHAKLDTSDPKRQQEYVGCIDYLEILLNNNYNAQFKVYASKAEKAMIEYCIHCCNKRDEK